MLVSNLPSNWLGATKSSSRSALCLLHVCLLAGLQHFTCWIENFSPSHPPILVSIKMVQVFHWKYQCCDAFRGWLLARLPWIPPYALSWWSFHWSTNLKACSAKLIYCWWAWRDVIWDQETNREKNHFYRYLALIICCQDSLFPSFFLVNIVKFKFHSLWF